MLKSFIIAFQTYSRIPMPQITWTESSMRYSICFFPVIGAVIGGFEILLYYLSGLIHIPLLIYAAIAAVIPLLITGAIHMDGYCDTVDALSSQGDAEKRLEILKDPHTGAFAIIFCAVWMLIYFASWTTIDSYRTLGGVCIGFVLSRAFSALALANFKGARKSGMLQTFIDASAKKTVSITMIAIIILCFAGMICLLGITGVIMAAAHCLFFLYYRLMSYKKFGGITGDLEGWLLQCLELITLLCTAVFINVL